MGPSFPTRRATVVSTVLLGLLWSSGVQAQEGGLLLQLDTEYERTRAPSATSGLRDVPTAGLSIDANGRMGVGHIAHAAFLDAHFGAGLQGGFAYRFSLLPLGLALYDRDQRAILSLASGLRMQGVTAHQPFAVQAPIRASFVSRLGSRLLLNAWLAQDFALNSRRENGATNALFGDELRAGLTIRLGRSGKKDGGRQSVHYGSGYFIGALYAERLGTEFWGITIGHSMNMRGTSDRQSRYARLQRGPQGPAARGPHQRSGSTGGSPPLP